MNCEPQRMAGQEYLLRRPLPIEVKNHIPFHGEDISHAMYVESAQRSVARLGTVENSSFVLGSVPINGVHLIYGI